VKITYTGFSDSPFTMRGDALPAPASSEALKNSFTPVSTTASVLSAVDSLDGSSPTVGRVMGLFFGRRGLSAPRCCSFGASESRSGKSAAFLTSGEVILGVFGCLAKRGDCDCLSTCNAKRNAKELPVKQNKGNIRQKYY
jgi:hypothetical protein